MARISFEDNNDRYIKSFVSRDYTELGKELIDQKQDLTYYIEDTDVLYGYRIAKNYPLTELYNADFYSVRFYFVNIDTLHREEQTDNIVKLLQHLDKKINECKGYYNLRIPTHIVDLIKAYNTVFSDTIFCGGTVEEYINGKEVPDNNKNYLNLFFADEIYINKNKELLLEMTYHSFETYQGQYHISNITDHSAGKIYENWIKNSLDDCSKDLIVVAEHEGTPIGFVTLGVGENSIEGILSAVSQEHRQYGAYKAMIAYSINYAYQQKKSFVTSTQFDNFIVQGAWASLGLKPFYSIYNIHVDRR